MNGSLRFPGQMFSELDRLQQQVEQLFRSAGGPAGIRDQAGESFPAINIGNTAEAIEVVAFAPGIDPNALQITIDKGLLVIAGERKSDLPAGDDRYSIYAHERFAGAFRRAVSLPEVADPAKVEAGYRDGFLLIKIGKRESSKPRRVQVN